MTTPRSPTSRRLQGLSLSLGNAPWAIRESQHRQLVQEFNHYLRAGPAAADQIEQLRAAREARSAEVDAAQQQAPGVAIVSLYGTILPRGNLMVELCGAASPHSFAEQVEQAAADPSVSSIILDIDSGGGAVSGIDVAAEAVRKANTVKPVTAVCNTMACSAALWIASQAGKIVITPAGEIGSIGVIGTHVDESALYEDAGLVVTYVRSVPGKALGQSTEAMDGPVLEQWQSEIDRIHTLFVNTVAAGRGVSADVVRERWATGQVWVGQDAVTQGLADEVGTLSDVVAARLRDAQAQQSAQARHQRRAADFVYRRVEADLVELERAAGASGADTLALQERAQALSAQLPPPIYEPDAERAADFAHLRDRLAAVQTRLSALTPTPPTPEEPPMKITLKAADGTTTEIDPTPEAVQAYLQGQLDAQASAQQTALADAAATLDGAQAAHVSQLTRIGALFGLTAEQATAQDLAPWEAAAERATQVSEYRESLLGELEALAVTVDGNSSAATQVVRLAGKASLPDLRTTVDAYRERRDAMVPSGRRSVDSVTESAEAGKEGKRPLPPRSFDNN